VIADLQPRKTREKRSEVSGILQDLCAMSVFKGAVAISSRLAVTRWLPGMSWLRALVPRQHLRRHAKTLKNRAGDVLMCGESAMADLE